MIKTSISKYLLFISITTFLAVFVLLVHKSYVSLITPTQEINKSDLLKPIDPSLDIKTLLDLENKPEYTDGQITAPLPSITIIPSVTNGPN